MTANLTTSFTIEPDVPRDPLAAAESASWARARHMAVLGLPLDERSLGVLAALEQMDLWLGRDGAKTGRDGAKTGRDAATAGAASVSRRLPTEEMPAVNIADLTDEVTDAPEVPPDAPPDELPGDIAEAIELSPDEIDEAAGEVEVASVEPEAGMVTGKRLNQLASAETIVLSGPEIRRKIRLKQSIMPSYMAQMLYEDIGALFEIGDREGALVSLERLLTVASLNPQIEAFLSHNEQRLLDYYETVLGPWTRTGRLREGETSMPEAYFRIEKVAEIVRHLDGTLPLSEVIARSGLRNIEACAVLSQLSRSGSLDLSEKA